MPFGGDSLLSVREASFRDKSVEIRSSGKGRAEGRTLLGSGPSGIRRTEPSRVIRIPARPRSRTQEPIPQQQELNLESLSSTEGVGEGSRIELEGSLPKEILLSRLLAAIIDVSMAILTGFVFCLLAAWELNLDFFSSLGFRLGIGCTVGFYLFNSFFFLIVAGQTPGMYLTDLRLVSEEWQEDVSLRALAIRILLYPTVAVTLVGLLWSLFDPLRRCLHDRISRTRVVPVRPGKSQGGNAF